jgi:hypothetical protein
VRPARVELATFWFVGKEYKQTVWSTKRQPIDRKDS